MSTAQFFAALDALKQRCEQIAEQRYPGALISGDVGTSGRSLVLTFHDETVSPPFDPADAASQEPAVSCFVQTGSTASAAPDSMPAGCASFVMVPVSERVYLFASGRTGTVTTNLRDGLGVDAPSDECAVPYGSLPTS